MQQLDETIQIITYLSSYNTSTTPESVLLGVQVHRTSLTLLGALFETEQFGNDAHDTVTTDVLEQKKRPRLVTRVLYVT